MDFEYTESEQNFREEVKSFLAENLPPKKRTRQEFSKILA